MCDETVKLWTSVRLVALDEAPGEELERRRKLQRIACAEPLLKFDETLVIEEEIKDVLKKLEPRRLRCGKPDAAPLLVRLVSSWAEDIQAELAGVEALEPMEVEIEVEDGKLQDRRPCTRQAELSPKPATQGTLGIDLENAYGRMFRSAALKSAKYRAPRTATMAATQRRAGANRIWCREGVAFRTIWTERGGWQGARSAQLFFAMSLEEAADNTQVMANRGITRVGLQDDTYAVAEPENLTRMLEELKIKLQACGNRLRKHKCKVWFPTHVARSVSWSYWERQRKESGAPQLDRFLGSSSDRLTTHLAKRLSNVQALIPRIHGLPLQADDGKSRHKAWMMLTTVAMRALDDDAKLIPTPILTELTREIHVLMDNAMCDILGCELEEGQRRLVQPGCFAGLGARRLSRGDRADAAHWATWDLHAQAISQLAAELGNLAEQARLRLVKAGIICARPNTISNSQMT